MSGNHDLGYKQLFSHPELVRDLLAGFTQLSCVSDLESSAFERVNASFVSERNSERHSDMVWRVRLANQVVYVYLLLEFQSHSERWMALRMQVYVGLLYQDLIKRREFAPAQALPPVLPVVFYNGWVRWSAPRDLRTLVADGPAELKEYQANQRYLLIDQRSVDPQALEGSRNVVAALFRLELSDSASALIDIVATIRVWLDSEEQLSLRRSIFQWISHLQKRELEGLPIFDIESVLLGEGIVAVERLQRKYATWAEAERDIGRQQGLEQGREEKLRALRSTLKGLLSKRFGDIPVAALMRVEQADEVEVERWIYRVVDAENVDMVVRP